MYLSTSTSTEDFPGMYLSTIQVLYKLYLSTDVLKYKVLLPGSGLVRCRLSHRLKIYGIDARVFSNTFDGDIITAVRVIR